MLCNFGPRGLRILPSATACSTIVHDCERAYRRRAASHLIIKRAAALDAGTECL